MVLLIKVNDWQWVNPNHIVRVDECDDNRCIIFDINNNAIEFDKIISKALSKEKD